MRCAQCRDRRVRACANMSAFVVNTRWWRTFDHMARHITQYHVNRWLGRASQWGAIRDRSGRAWWRGRGLGFHRSWHRSAVSLGYGAWTEDAS